jgi:hypothetical protein
MPSPREPVRPPLTTDADRARQGALADLVAPIERAAADLSLAEEPAGFVAALEAGAPSGEAAPRPTEPGRG